MEIVTEPDFTTAEQCREYPTQLRLILRAIGVSSANMEEGALRAEPTVNLRDPETGEATPKVEIKNLNSIRAVFEAGQVRDRAPAERWPRDARHELIQQTRRWDEKWGHHADAPQRDLRRLHVISRARSGAARARRGLGA